MKIRKAQSGDAKAISELITCLTEKYILPTWDEKAHELLISSMSVSSVEHYLTQGYVYHLAENEQNDLIGVVATRDNSPLYHLFVREDYKGQGLSRTLWEQAKAGCISKGNPGVFTVNSAVNAEPVYLSFGFRRVDGIRNREGAVDIPMRLDASEKATEEN